MQIQKCFTGTGYEIDESPIKKGDREFEIEIKHTMITDDNIDSTIILNLFPTINNKLLQCTGRYCERYAGDILYDFESIKEWVHEKIHLRERFSKRVFYFGFREMGVDGEQMMKARLSAGEIHAYRAVYAEEISVVMTECDCNSSSCEVMLTAKLMRME